MRIMLLAAITALPFVAGCTSGESVTIDGSSTVYPVTQAVAEEFNRQNSEVKTVVGTSGTGGGFKKFLNREIDINDASRPIKEKESSAAAEKGIEYIELPVAFDGLSVVVNPANTWVDHFTVEELKRIWQPDSTVKTWQDVREGWPAQEIELFAPGTASGTFDYFTEAIVGESGACRNDFSPSEDDNVLVRGIAGDENALGFFGYAYYVENQDKLKLVPIDNGNGPVAPSEETINSGTYAPLSRPIFIYVRKDAAERPAVADFVRFYLQHAGPLSSEVGYVPLPARVYDLVRQRFENRKSGTVFQDAQPGVDLEQLLSTGT